MRSAQAGATVTETLTFDGITKPINEWALDYGVYPNVITDRLTRGWSIDRAITTPMMVAPNQRLASAYMPGLPKMKRDILKASSLPRLRRNQAYEHEGLSLTLLQWSQRKGISSDVLRGRIRRGMTLNAALAVGVQAKRMPGVVKNLPGSQGTGGGSTAQDISQIEFSQ